MYVVKNIKISNIYCIFCKCDNYGNTTKKNLGSFIYYIRKIFRETNNSYHLIRTRSCAYQGVRNVSFSENFAHKLNGRSLLEFPV